MPNRKPKRPADVVGNAVRVMQIVHAVDLRVADVSFNTVAKLLIDAGKVCAAYHDEHVRNVTSKRVQCDEIWSFTYAKQKNVALAKAAPAEAGDTWTALDAEREAASGTAN